MESGATRGAKPGARGARDAQAVVHAPRASKKKKGEDWQNDFTEFLPGRNKAVEGGKSGFDKKPLPARIKTRKPLIVFPKPVFSDRDDLLPNDRFRAVLLIQACSVRGTLQLFPFKSSCPG
ncbi:MAG: hypothetical protein ACLR8Y_03860 [Alistipes indistinctus]